MSSKQVYPGLHGIDNDAQHMTAITDAFVIELPVFQ